MRARRLKARRRGVAETLLVPCSRQEQLPPANALASPLRDHAACLASTFRVCSSTVEQSFRRARTSERSSKDRLGPGPELRRQETSSLPRRDRSDWSKGARSACETIGAAD